ncbi:MAG: HlyD family secretion protein [Pseudomonadota bacterium]
MRPQAADDPAQSARRLGRWGLAVVAALVLVVGVWGALAPLSQAVIVPGAVVAAGTAQRLAAPIDGRVEAPVAAGARVAAGGVVATLVGDRRVRLTAPVDGVITAIAGEGAGVGQGEGVATLLPTGEGVALELSVAPQDVAAFQEGARVTVRFARAPNTPVPATVVFVPGVPLRPGPAYGVRVAAPGTAALGETATVALEVGRQPALSALLAPLVADLRTALRER